jgi:mRNA interferase RelE/StbE
LVGVDGTYRLRVGVYRILYEVDDARAVVDVFRVAHRKEAYR